ncbi:hypothetical protein MNBD_NITROSPINAE04-2410 [hydrothermal vent metagenome]|uniref:Uncharacterized protein n=1 Tax=hydrothermal vent metagenome TaxID=652676 RepID=A0A3B1BTI6_9ZZZZ
MDRDKLKGIVEADPGVVGEDFCDRLYIRLKEAGALEKSGLENFGELTVGYSDNRKLRTETFLETYTQQIKELEEHIRLDADYVIPSHRKGLMGAIDRFIKKTVTKIKLRADLQVIQQERFNQATLVSLQLTAAHLDFLKGMMEEMQNDRKTERDTQIALLKEEIASLKERIDER